MERSEFELPVPVSKLSDDSIMLEFATVRRVAALGDALISRELVLPRSVRGHVDNGRRIARFLPRSFSRTAERGPDAGIRAAHKVRVHARFAKLLQALALLA